ncbi:MAG: GntR family transcriptional regulator [Hyphomicrobiales bacterium]|jgi:DNA-binding GntR family transcriptional regulator|nr:GntR family transcriptional regulator [Hyphomicrobiales bacterium]
MAFQTKQDHVAEILRERIIAGIYARGDKLKQADIAAELGVSITPVREALQMLEAEGYVQGLAHKGVLVPELVAERQQEIFDLRLNLEQELTLHAIRNMAKTDLKLIQSIQKQLNEAIRNQDINAVRTENYRFHFKLYELAQRPQTLKFVRVLWAQYPFTRQDKTSSRPDTMRKEHEHFLEQLAAGNEAGAVQAMLDHIQSGWKQLHLDQ